MPAIRPEDLTPFARAALDLDRVFAELAKLGGQMEELDIESDRGVDDGVRLLNKAAVYSESLGAAMQEFSKTLQEAREQAEAGMKSVAERGRLIKERRQREDELQAKLEALREELKAAGAGAAAASAPPPPDLPEAEIKSRIAAELQRLQEPMTRFVQAAQGLKDEAARSNFKRLERQADSMIDSLQASLRKIAQAIAPKQP